MLPRVFSSPCSVTLLRRSKMFAVPRRLGLNFPLMCIYSTHKLKPVRSYGVAIHISELRKHTKLLQINMDVKMEAEEGT
jgi:hypothetical protein